MSAYDEDQVKKRVQEEVDSLSDSELRTFRYSQKSMESWIYRTAQTIGRILSAPFRWIADIIRGILDGFFS